MTLAEIRTRLAGLEGRAYWRSLEELSETPEFRDYLHREFPVQASEFTDPAGRRQFLKLMGASLALAGVSACTRQPDEKIIPYVRQPEEIIPGRPLFYATAMPLGGFGFPLLAENHMGRPTKLEGNPGTSGEPRRHRSLRPDVDPDAVRPRPIANGRRRRRSTDLGSVRHRSAGGRRVPPRAQGRRDFALLTGAGHVAVAHRPDREASRGNAGSQMASVGRGLRRAPGRGSIGEPRSIDSTRPMSSSRSTPISSVPVRGSVRYTQGLHVAAAADDA